MTTMRSFPDFAHQITSNKLFRGLIFTLIILSAVIIGMETYPPVMAEFGPLLHWLDKLIVYSFVAEIMLKIIAGGKRPWSFFSDPWNVFDFVVVATSLLPAGDMHFVAALRILRLLRVLRMINFLPKFRILVSALLRSIPSMGYVILLLSLLFYIYGIIGVFLFGKADPTHFGDLHHALVTLFKVLTLEGWTEIMAVHLYTPSADGTEQIENLWPFLYFASFIVIGAMIIMNLFIGVIMNSMDESQEELSRELQEIRFKDQGTDELYRHILTRLEELQKEIRNLKGTGMK
jgi:voltage-gated sodium channel